MKIYQIHEYSGGWEDAFDRIVDSYLSKEKAIKELERLDSEAEIKRRCNACPLYFCEEECDGDCEKCEEQSFEKAKAYCNRYKPFGEEHDCANYSSDNDKHYRIVEVDVIE